MAAPAPGPVVGAPMSSPAPDQTGPDTGILRSVDEQPAPEARRARRWQIGLAGLGGVLLLVALSSIVAGSRNADPATSAAPGATAPAASASGDPLSDLGVLPDDASGAGGQSAAEAAGAANAAGGAPSASPPPPAPGAAASDSAVIGARTEPIVPDLEGPAQPVQR